MYIEQGYHGALGKWKYLVLPVSFLGLILINYFSVFNSQQNTAEIIQSSIASMGKPMFFFFSLFPFVILLGALFIWVRLVHKQELVYLTTSRKKIDWSRVFFMFALMTILITASTVMAYLATPREYELNFDLLKFSKLAAMAIFLIPIQSSFEEYFFRGYLVQGIGILSGWRWIAWILSAVLFGLMHIANPEVGKFGHLILIYYIGTGFFLGMITLLDEGLELALGFHAANNLITALLVTSSWSALQTDSIFLQKGEPVIGLELLAPLFIVFPILSWILHKKYKWQGWKSKLFGRVSNVY